MSDKLHTEDLIRKKLEGAELSPSPESWSAIRQKLRWPQFLRFYPGRFNIYYAGLILLAASAIVLLLAVERDRKELPAVENETIARSSQEPSAQAKAESSGAGETGIKESQASAIESPSPENIPKVQNTEKLSTDTGKEELNPGEASADQAKIILPPLNKTDEQELTPPLTYFTSSVRSGCAPLRVQFTDQSVNASSHHWDFGTGDESTEANPSFLFKEPGRYMVSLTTTNHGSLETVSRMLIEVAAPPVADFQIEEGLQGVDEHVVLNLVNYSSDATLYEWCLVDESQENCSAWSSGDQQPNLELTSITPESRAVRLRVISEFGCMDTTTMPLPLVVESSKTRIKFATAFSPNPSGPGDGSFMPGSKRIDLFYPIYIEVPVEFHMRVFTRRGEQIFETREIYRGWDGYMYQEPAPGDVYIWMAEGKWADGESFSLRGDVTLVWNKYW
jgi:PKD repeat protein